MTHSVLFQLWVLLLNAYDISQVRNMTLVKKLLLITFYFLAVYYLCLPNLSTFTFFFMLNLSVSNRFYHFLSVFIPTVLGTKMCWCAITTDKQSFAISRTPVSCLYLILDEVLILVLSWCKFRASRSCVFVFNLKLPWGSGKSMDLIRLLILVLS